MNSTSEPNRPTVEVVDVSLEIEHFRLAREISARATKFKQDHRKDWIHGIPNFRSLITYTSSQSDTNTNSKYDSHCVPNLTLSSVSTWKSTRHSSLDTTNSAEDAVQTNNHHTPLQSDDFVSPFSGLLHLPSFSLTRSENYKFHAPFSQYVMPTRFEIGEITYFFGGMQCSPSMSLKQLGIPRSTDPSLISVHFPCDLPPFVDKKALQSPYFMRNPSFAIFNPIRSTVHDFSKPLSADFQPGHFCEMVGTRISEFQIFFCGGFKVNVDKVEFDQNSGRWIVEKSVSTNDNGYILDVRRLSFKKISLVSRSEFKYRGRIGSGICSNYSSQIPVRKDLVFESQSPSSTDVSEFFSGSNSKTLNPRDIYPGASPVSVASYSSPQPSSSSLTSEKRSSIQGSTSNSSSSFSAKLSGKIHESRRFQNLKESESVISNAAYSSVSQSYQAEDTQDMGLNRAKIDAGSVIQEPLFSPSDTTGRISAKTTGATQFEIRQDSAVLEVSSPSPRVPAMIAKSGKIFQRTPQTHPETTGQPSSAHNSYASRVKQHRSKTVQSSSPSTKFIISSEPSGLSNVSDETGDIENCENQHSTLHNTKRHNMSGDVPMGGSVDPLDPSRMGEEFGSDSTNKAYDSNGTRDSRSHIQGENDQKSDQKSGISSVCVYMFGGFIIEQGSYERQSFKAVNDLLKLELIISDNAASDFHPEALVDTVLPQSSAIPQPRGYFASLLTSRELATESCKIFGPGCRTSENVSSFVSDDSDDSVETDDSFQSFIPQDNMFLIVHGGVNENGDVFGDCFYFKFNSEIWVPLETFAFDYFEIPKKPYEDEDSSKLQLENQVDNAKLVDAELRSCHHKAISYWEGDKEYVAFVGGFNNDFLRHFDDVPYESSKLDVSRFAKLSMSSVNPTLLRIPVLNIRSQVWKFKRYFYDLAESAKPEFIELMSKDFMKNTRLAINGGGISIVGKQLTFCHGLVHFVPEKKNDFKSIQEALDNSSVLLGGHFHLTFPGM